MSGERLREAIATITRETGYPPSVEELADVLGLTTRQVHSRLLSEKRAGRVGYDDDGNLIARPV